MKILTLFLIPMLFVEAASAKIVQLDPVRATADMHDWESSLALRADNLHQKGDYPADGYAECRETTEFKGTYLCLFPNQLEMNLAFGRASIFVEGDDGISAGQVVALDNPTILKYNDKILGHDLKSKDLLHFLAAADLACAANPKMCYSIDEADLVKNFIQPRVSDPNFIVIAAPLTPSNELEATITHEMSHAQYFNEPVFQQTVHSFWLYEISDADRAKIIDVLSTDYDPNDQVLIENEFQAFTLESAASTSLLHDLAPKYRLKLIEALTAAGVAPIFAHLD